MADWQIDKIPARCFRSPGPLVLLAGARQQTVRQLKACIGHINVNANVPLLLLTVVLRDTINAT